MPILKLKTLECERPHAASLDTNVRLNISVDEGHDKTQIKFGTVSFRDRKTINKPVPFKDKITLTLKFRIDKQIGNTLKLNTQSLPHQREGMQGFLHRGVFEFDPGKTKYIIYYEVVPDRITDVEFHKKALGSFLSLRETLGRTGRGAMTLEEQAEVLAGLNANYTCSEVISVKDIFSFHRSQDGEKGRTSSLRKWIQTHCNIWGTESVIPIEQLPVGVTPVPLLLSVPNYSPVMNEQSCTLSGFVTESRFANEDNPATHMSRDWIFNIIPSPAFSYMLAYTAKTKSVIRPGDSDPERAKIPLSHNEWESGSIPNEWRPETGEYVTVIGRHIFDRGHMPMASEIHPPHTIVREATKGKFNVARIGMGFSGGFPGSVQAETKGEKGELHFRWSQEFGGFLEQLSLRNRRCWPTNLKKHPLSIKLFPPVPKPSPGAVLKSAIEDWKIIIIKENRINDFLKRCGAGGLEVEKISNNFDNWFSEGLQINPEEFKPVLSERNGFFDVVINLSNVQEIPVAYYAKIICGWE